MIDLIVPTVTGREATLERCLESYHRCTAKDVLTVIVIKDEETCGIAWKKGMALSKAPYVHLNCDDLQIRSETWAGVCCETEAKAGCCGTAAADALPVVCGSR